MPACEHCGAAGYIALVPDNSETTLVVDVLNAYDHPDADALVESMGTAVDPIAVEAAARSRLDVGASSNQDAENRGRADARLPVGREPGPDGG